MVGDILRKAREKQGLTIADIEEGTSIRKLYIEHIERGNIDALPGMVYAKGFVRNYAAFLHLDAEHLVQQFAEENGAPPAPVPAEPETKPRRISLSSVGDESLSQISIGGRRSSYAGIFGKLALGIIVLAALVGGGAALISAINSPAKETAAPAPTKTEQPAPTSVAAEADASDAARTSAASAQDVRVSVHLTERSWMEVQVDGNVVLEGIIESGRTENWQANDAIIIRAGNAGALEVTANGKKLGRFGNEGEVVERRFTKETKDLRDTLPPAPPQEAPAAQQGQSRATGVKDARGTKGTRNQQ